MKILKLLICVLMTLNAMNLAYGDAKKTDELDDLVLAALPDANAKVSKELAQLRDAYKEIEKISSDLEKAKTANRNNRRHEYYFLVSGIVMIGLTAGLYSLASRASGAGWWGNVEIALKHFGIIVIGAVPTAGAFGTSYYYSIKVDPEKVNDLIDCLNALQQQYAVEYAALQEKKLQTKQITEISN